MSEHKEFGMPNREPGTESPRIRKGNAGDSLVAIGGVCLFGVLLLFIMGIQVVRTSVVAIRTPGITDFFQKQELPIPRRLQDPHAILVLDVSGSMRTSDPGHLQTEAVLRFFDVYRELAKETLEGKEKPHLAIVFFSTLAQTVTWDDQGSSWLEVTEVNRPRFQSLVERYLGRIGSPDPRVGEETDYLHALRTVRNLAHGKNIQSPPAVVFMTDGKNEPYATLPDGAMASHPDLPRRMEALLKQNAHISASGSAPLFSRSANQLPDLTHELKSGRLGLASYDLQCKPVEEEIHALIETITSEARFGLAGSGEGVPFLWAPILLTKSADCERAGKALLSPAKISSSPWPERGIQVCTNGNQLGESFLITLSDWFQFSHTEGQGTPPSVSVPQGTQAFAALVQTQEGVRNLHLTGPQGQRVPMEGHGTLWTCVAKGDGRWHAEGDGIAKTIAIYSRPRHTWILHVPSLHVVNPQEKSFQVELHLYSLEQRRVVASESVRQVLPASFPGTLKHEHGEAREIQFTRTGHQATAIYRAELPTDLAGGRRKIDLEIKLPDALRQLAGTRETSLKQRIELRPSVQLIARNASRMPTAIDVQRIPSTLGRLRSLFSRSQHEQ